MRLQHLIRQRPRLMVRQAVPVDDLLPELPHRHELRFMGDVFGDVVRLFTLLPFPLGSQGSHTLRHALPTSARRCGCCLFIVHTEPAMHTRTDRG